MNNLPSGVITPTYYYHHDIAFEFACNVNKNHNLGNPKNKVCKFCGRTDKDTEFKNRAHIIPMGLGNNRLFSNEECDECNHKFGREIDSDLVTYLGIERVINNKMDLQTHKVKIRGKKSYIKRDKGVVIINSDWEANPSVKVAVHDGKMHTTILYPPFRPLNICKALARIALFCMPKENLEKNQQVWEYFQGKIKFPLRVLTYYIPGLNAAPAVHILVKKNMLSNEPSSVISLYYGNFLLMLPFLKDDEVYTKICDIQKPKVIGNHLVVVSDKLEKGKTITFVLNTTGTLIGENISKDKKIIDKLIGSDIYDISE